MSASEDGGMCCYVNLFLKLKNRFSNVFLKGSSYFSSLVADNNVVEALAGFTG